MLTQEIKNRLSALKKWLEKTSVDAALISSPLNIRYLCGFSFTDGYLLITKDNAYLITDSRYGEAARANAPLFCVKVCRADMLATLYSLLRSCEVRTLALEDASISCSAYQKMSSVFKDVTLTTGVSDILSEHRAVKSPYELQKIAQAQALTDMAFEHILTFISPDRTEAEVALELEFFMRRHGAEGVAFDTIAVSGASSSLPHGVPSQNKLSRGFLTMDFGALFNGYCSDMTRTVVIGKADSEMKRVYNTVLSAQEAALERICEGIPCFEADRIARSVIEAAGYGEHFGHGLGHGVGMYIHEVPSLSRRAAQTDILRRGNVVTVEPGIYLEGKYGCRIEDMIAIEHDGSVRNFTKSPKHLIEI